MNIAYQICPICAEEWLPDRCMSIKEPLDIGNLIPQYGCPNLLFGKSQIQNRIEFEEFYSNVLNRYACCGFVAWEKGRVIGYTNFFPHGIARKIKFYGWGGTDGEQPDTLVHYCISIVQYPDYRHKGIGSSLVRYALVRYALEWAKTHQWKRYEVHRVLPDVNKGVENEQKSVLSFWRKFRFSVIGEEEADEAIRKFYGVDKRYSLALDL